MLLGRPTLNLRIGDSGTQKWGRELTVARRNYQRASCAVVVLPLGHVPCNCPDANVALVV